MKCAECSDRWKCGAGYDLRRKRRGCEKAKKPAKRSNADRIRSMTDEELADELVEWFACFSAVEWTREMICDWLKQVSK